MERFKTSGFLRILEDEETFESPDLKIFFHKNAYPESQLVEVQKIMAHIWPLVVPRIRRNICRFSATFEELSEKSHHLEIENSVTGDAAGVFFLEGATIVFSFSFKGTPTVPRHAFLMMLGENERPEIFYFAEYPTTGNDVKFASEKLSDLLLVVMANIKKNL